MFLVWVSLVLDGWVEVGGIAWLVLLLSGERVGWGNILISSWLLLLRQLSWIILISLVQLFILFIFLNFPIIIISLSHLFLNHIRFLFLSYLTHPLLLIHIWRLIINRIRFIILIRLTKIVVFGNDLLLDQFIVILSHYYSCRVLIRRLLLLVGVGGLLVGLGGLLFLLVWLLVGVVGLVDFE